MKGNKGRESRLIERFKEDSRNRSRENKAFLEKLRKRAPGDLDTVVESLHEEAFEQIDCLLCANCCKTTSPILIDRDIDRIARRLKIKPSQLIEAHLRLDEEGDYVFRQAPCPFLMPDNYCMISSHDVHSRVYSAQRQPVRRPQPNRVEFFLTNTDDRVR